MRYFLYTTSALSTLHGLGLSVSAKGAIHEIEILLVFLIASVLFCTGAIISKIER